MQRLQNRALRIIFGHHQNLSTNELHEQANLTNLVTRANQHLTCLMYKQAHYFSAYPFVPNAWVTRANQKIRFNLPRPTTERYKQFPLYYGAKLWDLLHHNTQRTDSYELLKYQLRRSIPDQNVNQPKG